MSFIDTIKSVTFDNIKEIISSTTEEKIISILKKDEITFNEFLALLSEKAAKFLPEMVLKSKEVTIKRFGKIINFYVPLYLSNECSNQCVYCGFNQQRDIIRKTLTFNEIEKDLEKIKDYGFDNILLLTGEHKKAANLDYIKNAVKMAKDNFTFVGLEIYPMKIEEYRELLITGARGLTIYQETYDIETYDKMHIKGKKKDYLWRLDTPERACIAGFRKVGLGALLGLFDWQYEVAMLALHINYLQKRYWKTEFTLGFPRINPPDDIFKIPYKVSDKNFLQLLSALRIYLPDVGFLLTTRERPELRDNLIGLMITQISAGSKTNPGGYIDNSADEQFHVSDNRTLEEMIRVVRKKGYDPVLKDWEKNFSLVC